MTESHWSKEYLDRAESLLTEAYRERDALRAEVEALRKDAERYRWMRSAYVSKIEVPSLRLGLNDADQFDAGIDAAIAGGK